MKIVFVSITNSAFMFNQAIAALSAYVKQESDSKHEIKLIVIRNSKHEYYNFAHQIEEYKPDVIGFSVMSVYWPVAKKLATLSKEVSDALTICGGYHPTFAPEEVISYPGVDIICRGEGEYAFLELLNSLEKGEDYTQIKNLWVKKEGKIFKNDIRPPIESLDSLPFLDRELFEYEKIGKENSLYNMYNPDFIIPVASGKGCYFNCTYCSNPSMKKLYKGKGNFIRSRSVDHLITEMELLKQKYNPDCFEVVEELFGSNNEWLEEFAEKYPKKVGVPFRIGYRVELATDKNIELLRKSGCVDIAYGVECGNEEYRRKYLNRKMSNEVIIEAFRRTQEAGIKILSYNIIGLPFETYENIQETIELNRKLRPSFLHWFVFQPLPGTKLYEICKENDLLLPSQQLSGYSSQKPQIKFTNITTEDFEKCMADFRALQRELQGFDWNSLSAQSNRRAEPVEEIRAYKKGDEYKILDLYNRIFNKNRNIGHWRWEYEQNPAGMQISVAVNTKGDIVGHYAGLPVWFNYKGEKGRSTQIVDSMVDEDYRKGLKKIGVFAKCMAHNGETFLEGRFYFAYGFPNKVHYRLGTTQHVKYPYKLIRKIDKLVKKLRPEKNTITEKIKHRLEKLNYKVEQITKFDERADKLWEKCAPELPLAIIRDFEYLNWRYIDCPSVNYLCIGVYHRKSDELRGWAVLRLNWQTKEATGLVDWLVPREDREVAEILLRNCEHSAMVGGTEKLEAWLPPYSKEYQFLTEMGFTEEKTKSVLVAHIFKPDLVDWEAIENHWYYTMGDSDVY